MRILLVEDNDELAGLISHRFARTSIRVDRVASLEEAKLATRMIQFALIVIDLGLPDGNGIALVRDLRARRIAAPILILTARSTLDDRLVGLRSGADDYLVKPFDMEELVARIDALLRRSGTSTGARLTVANVLLDTETRQVTIDGQPSLLGTRETALLELLLARAGKVVTIGAMEDAVARLSGETATTNAITVYLHRLRRHLGSAQARAMIHTVRGVGYLLSESNTN